MRRIRLGEEPARVRDEVLDAGSSLALVAVAVSVLVDTIDAVTDELDMFLEHPLVWDMEYLRVVHEHEGIALEVPDAIHLDWTFSHIAMQLVLRGGDARRERLREIGQILLGNHAELARPDSQLLARRWASELDLSRYMAEPQDDGAVVSVTYDDEVTQGLAARGNDATRSLHAVGLLMRAIALRDGTIGADAEPDTAASVWREAGEAARNGTLGEGVYRAQDVLAAAAAAVVISAAAGGEETDADLAGAVSLLTDGAAFFAGLAPPQLTSPGAAADREARPGQAARFVRDMAMDVGADRSIAAALTVMLCDPPLCTRAGISAAAVAAAAEAVAASPFDQTRERLTAGLRRVWSMPCPTHGTQHQAAVAVARRLIATAGYGPRRSPAHGYPPATLPEPLEDLLATSDGMVLDVASASYAVDLLAVGQAASCPHGQAARQLLGVLTGYDERAWPRHYARRRYRQARLWREAIDSALAVRILDGDTGALTAHLTAFTNIAEDLRGLLHQLSAAADTNARTTQLFAVWPQVLDRLLPDARDMTLPGTRGNRPYPRDVDDLDAALLLVPPPDGPPWPAPQLLDLGLRWFTAFQGHARLADRAIVFSARLFGLGHPVSIHPVLAVLGDNPGEISRQSQLAVPFLHAALTNAPAGPAADNARHLLDRLAATGDADALRAQQQLEA